MYKEILERYQNGEITFEEFFSKMDALYVTKRKQRITEKNKRKLKYIYKKNF